MQDWFNFYYEQAYRLAISNFENIIIQGAFEKSQLRAILESMSFADFVSQSK